MAQNKEITVAIAIVLILVAGIMLLKYTQSFAISENDLITTGTRFSAVVNPGESYDQFLNFSINTTTNTISFTLSNRNITYSVPVKFFMLDNSPVIYDTFQDITEGTHTIKEYQLDIWNNQVQIKKWEKTYDVLIKTVYQNITISNETFYVDKPVNVTTTVYVNQTVEKKVYIEPDLNAWVKKYQLYLIGIIGIGLIYYLTKVRRKR